MTNEFTHGVEAMAKVALDTLKQVLIDNMGPLDPHTLQQIIYDDFEAELMGRV